MKTLHALAMVACFSLLLITAETVRSQNDEAKEPKAKQSAADAERSQTKKSAKRERPRRRLPNYYGQVGLSDEQRNTIYEIQAKYRAEIEELEKKLEALRGRRDTEIHDVLTDEQKEKLAGLLKAAQERRRNLKLSRGQREKAEDDQ